MRLLISYPDRTFSMDPSATALKALFFSFSKVYRI